MRKQSRKIIAIVMSVLMVLPLFYQLPFESFAEDGTDTSKRNAETKLKFTELKVVQGDEVIADLLKGEVPSLHQKGDYSFIVGYDIPQELRNKPTYLDVELGNGLYFTALPGSKFEIGPIANNSFSEITSVPEGNAGAPYGYPEKVGGKIDIKGRTGKAEFKTNDGLLEVYTKKEIAFKIDEAYENSDPNQIFNDVIKFSLRTDSEENINKIVSNVNAADEPHFGYEVIQKVQAVDKNELTDELEVSSSSGNFLTKKNSTTTVDVVYPDTLEFKELEETSSDTKHGTVVKTVTEGNKKITTVSFEEPGRLLGGLKFKPKFVIPNDTSLEIASMSEVNIRNLKVDVWGDEPNSTRTSTNAATMYVCYLTGDAPQEVLTRIALTDTMQNWSKDKYDSYNVRLGSMLLKNEIAHPTSAKTLEMEIDKNNTAIIRGVTIPYWKGIEYGPIEWTSKNGKSGIFNDFKKLVESNESALLKNTALGLDVNDSIASIKVDLGAIPKNYEGTKYILDNITGAISKESLGKKNESSTTWQAFYDYGFYPIGVWGAWREKNDKDVITEVKLYETGKTAKVDETYKIVGKSMPPVVKAGAWGSISESQINASDDNNHFTIKGNIGMSDWDLTILQEPVIYVIMPEGFTYSDLSLTNATLSDPEYIGEFKHEATKVRVWKYDVSLPDGRTTNGQYQPDFGSSNIELSMKITADKFANVGTYHINDFIGLTTKDFKKIGAIAQNLRWHGANWNTEKYTKDFGDKVNSGLTMASIASDASVTVNQAAKIEAHSKLVGSENDTLKDFIYEDGKDSSIYEIKKGATADHRINIKNNLSGKSMQSVELFVPLMNCDSYFGEGFNPKGQMSLPLTLGDVKIGVKDGFKYKLDYLKVDGKKLTDLLKTNGNDLKTMHNLMANGGDGIIEILSDEHKDDANMIMLTTQEAIGYGEGISIDINYKADKVCKLSGKDEYIDVISPYIYYNLGGNVAAEYKEPAAIKFEGKELNYVILGEKPEDSKEIPSESCIAKGTNYSNAAGAKAKLAALPTTSLTDNGDVLGTWKFDGWYDVDSVDLDKNIVKDGAKPIDNVTINKNTTLYGFWTFIPDKISINVDKKWVGTEAKSVEVVLLHNDKEIGREMFNKENNWHFEFKNLLKYKDAEAHKYTVTEVKVGDNEVKDGKAGNYKVAISGDADNGYTITNTYVSSSSNRTSIPVTKKWVGKKGQSATIYLYADGKQIDTVVLNEKNHWQHTFTTLPKYKDGKEIKYTIKEKKLADYDSVITNDPIYGFTITNTINSKVNIPVTKKWVGGESDKVKVHLYADGKEIDSKVITKADKWHYVFKNLDKYENDKEIKYTISEDKVKGFKTSVTGNAKDGFVITNTKNNAYVAESNKPNEPKSPKTGDEGNLMAYGLIMLMAAGAFVAARKVMNNKLHK